MQFNFLGGPKQPRVELDQIITRIDLWYDADQFKVWVVTCFNSVGDQVNGSIYEHLKSEGMRAAFRIIATNGGSEKVQLRAFAKDNSGFKIRKPTKKELLA